MRLLILFISFLISQIADGQILNASAPYRVRASGGCDADAQEFIDSSGITDATQQSAICTLVSDLKTAGIWNKFYAIYPLVGGTAATHKWNLVDPRDLDAAYRMTFNGSFTHNSNGITGGGTNSDYADTHINGQSVLDKVNSSWSFYSKTDANSLTSDYNGLGGDEEILTRFGGTFYHDIPRESNRFTFTMANSLGFFNGNLGSSDVIVYKNGSSVGSKGSAATVNYTNINMTFCAGYPGRASIRTLAFASVGTYLDATEAAAFYTAVQAFETTLGRQE